MIHGVGRDAKRIARAAAARAARVARTVEPRALSPAALPSG
jgi:hypothetical protein